MAENKEKRKSNEVVAPTLFMGVGGTGCKIVKRVAELCTEAEAENINFLCLDTNVNDLGDVAKSKKKIYWVQTSNTQTVGSYLDFDEDARKKWFPKNAVMYDKTVSEGAGQVRAISRLALNATIKTGKIRPLYDAIDELFRKTGQEMKQAMRVVIASTASGGTGSGIILPLSMFIRNYVKEKYPNTSLIVRALILLPETLDSVISSQTERDSQARNAYATIKELNAFMMKGSGFIDMDDDLKQFKNLGIDVSVAGSDARKTLSLLPLDFCFLMDGQDAEDSTMVSIGQYITQAAQALYEQNIGPMQKKAFSVEDNIIKEMTKPGNYGRNRFGGIGAGVVRYPYENVADYIAYDLAIDSIGGEGDATKWTKYDNMIANYKAEQKRLGVPMSTWDKDGKVYINAISNAKDSFSKDLKNTFELDNTGVEKNIKAFLRKFNARVDQIVLQDKRFPALQATAKDYGEHKAYGTSQKSIRDAYNNLASYAELVTSNDKNGISIIAGIASRWVEGEFTSDRPVASIQEEYCIESLMRNAQGEFFHPCAARYLLYRLQEEFEKVVATTNNFSDDAVSAFSSKEYKSIKYHKGTINGLDELTQLEKEGGPSVWDKMHGYKEFCVKAGQELRAYYAAIEEYREKKALNAAYSKAKEYIDGYIEQYESFFKTFVSKVKDLNRKKTDLVDELKYKKGDSFINVCATEDILKELSKFSLQKAQKETTMLNKEVNSDIFEAVKKNAIFKKELELSGDSYIGENRHKDIFDDILMEYFKKSVREKCDDIDKDIIEALALEKRMNERSRLRNESGENEQIFDDVSNADMERHIIEIIKKGGIIAAPSVQKVVNEEPREINVCAYNKSLLDNRRFRVKDLMPNGEAVDTVSKYEIHFYNALYNLTPDKLKKFAAPFDTETGHKSAGTYHKAYMDYSKLIGPDSTKNAAVSTHIDKRWDSIKSMPEIDFKYQALVVKRVHKAFIYGLVHKAIQHRVLSTAAHGKKVFLYRNSESRDEELVVPNGTLCDEFYEILDALYVNSKVVEDISLVKNRKRAQSEAKNCNYEDTEFFRDMADFNLIALMPKYEEFKDDVKDKIFDGYDGTQCGLDNLKDVIRKNNNERVNNGESDGEGSEINKRYVENISSLFEVPLMYYCTLPNSARFISEFAAMVDAVIDVFREEYTKWEKEEDVKFLLCTRLTDEFNLLKKNYPIYHEYLNAPDASDNPVIDIIQRKIRDVILSAPEPEDYEELLDKVAKEFNDKQD